MNRIYFEVKGEELLRRIGMNKSEFARRMGIHRQNVGTLFKTKNLETIYKAAHILGVPLQLLVGYVDEPELSVIPLAPYVEEDIWEITEDDIPRGIRLRISVNVRA